MLPASAVASVPTIEDDQPKALGLVDELDDPGPGHLSDHLHPISSTTTVESKPLIGSLEQRFVRASEEGGSKVTDASVSESEGDSDAMMVDPPDERKDINDS